jgi:ABC-2 type transport system permease protein
MNETFAFLRRELYVTFRSPFAYFILGVLSFLSGYFFFSLLSHYQTLAQRPIVDSGAGLNLNDWVMLPFFRTLELLLVFFCPLLTMRLVPAERHLGQLEFFLSTPISLSSFVFGKFLSAFLLLLLITSTCFFGPLYLFSVAEFELGPVLLGFFGIFLLVALYSSVGLALSSFCKTQATSGLFTLILFLLLHTLAHPGVQLPPLVQYFLSFLSPSSHCESLFRGVLSSSDLSYFLSGITLGLFFSIRALEFERVN